MPRFPVAFRPPAFSFSVTRYPPGSWALLTVGLPSTLRARPDLDGVTAFRTHELRPGWVPSIPRGRRCSSRTEWRAQPAPAASQRPALDPAPTSHLARMHFTRHQRGFKQFTRPAIPLACDRPDGTGRHLGFPPSFAPRRPGADNARRGGDRPSSTDLKLLAQHHIGLILQSCSSLTACDFASQRQRCASPRPRRRGVVIGHTACPPLPRLRESPVCLPPA